MWLKEFYHSASGASAQEWIGKTKRADRLPWPGKECIKILFPTLRTVRESRLGEAVSLPFSLPGVHCLSQCPLPGWRNNVLQEGRLGIGRIPEGSLS